MRSIDHIHKYRRRKYNKLYYYCIHPECSHTIHRDLLLGKRAICNRCEEPFIINSTSLQRVKPWCCNKDCPNLTGETDLIESLVLPT